MSLPQITWYAKTSGADYQSGQEFYAGTYTGREALTVNLQIWNNRWGVTDVESIGNAAMNFYFDTTEDSSLLKFCTIKVGSHDQMPLVIKDGKATVAMGRILSGVRNNGDPSSAVNKDNYVNIVLKFDAANNTLKNSDMKNMYFEVVSLD